MLSSPLRSIARALAALALVSFALAADADLPLNDDGTPKRIIAGFLPKVWPCFVGAGAFGVLAIVQWTHYFRMAKGKYLLNTTIGLTTMSIGFILRYLYIQQPDSIMRYSVQNLFILLSPCAYLAFVYCLLHKLAESLGPRVSKACLLLPARLIVKLFVWCDVVVFLLQSGGGGMSVSAGTMGTVGKWMSFVGLAFQVVSFGLFTILLIVFAFRVRRNFPDSWYVTDQHGWSSFSLTSTSEVDDWRALLWVMAICCVCIIIRCVFRVVEAYQGYTGYLHHHEGYFYVLDSLPLLICMSLFCFLWPARCVGAYVEHDSIPLAHTTNIRHQQQDQQHRPYQNTKYDY